MNKQAIFESVKEVGRWLACLLIGWIIAETLKQMSVLPEFAVIKVWLFEYSVPIRVTVQAILTFLARAVDKYGYEINKLGERAIKLPF